MIFNYSRVSIESVCGRRGLYCTLLSLFLAAPRHKLLMTSHAKQALTGSGEPKSFDPPFTVPTVEALRAEDVISTYDSLTFTFSSTVAAAAYAVTTHSRTVAQEVQVRVRINECIALLISEATCMSPIASYVTVSCSQKYHHCFLPNSRTFPSPRISPQPLQQYKISSSSACGSKSLLSWVTRFSRTSPFV